MGTQIFASFFLHRRILHLCLPFYSLAKRFVKQLGSLFGLRLARVETLMVELVLEHEQLGALIVSLLLEHNAVLKHGALERNQTEVVIFFEFAKSFGDEGDSTLVIEHTAKGLVQDEHNAAALYIVLRKESVDGVFFLLKRSRCFTLLLFADVLKSLVVYLLAFAIQQLFDLLQSTKS